MATPGWPPRGAETRTSVRGRLEVVDISLSTGVYRPAPGVRGARDRLPAAAGQRPARQARARPDDGHSGLRVDRTASRVRTAQGQLRAAAGDPRSARSDPAPESARPDRNSQVNRVGRILELANVKLGSVVSDIMGVTGRATTEAMIAGEEDPGPCSNTTPNPKRRGRRPAHRDARAANPRVVSDAVRRGSRDGRRGATSDVRCEVAPASASHPSHRPAVRACPARSESHRAARRGARPSPGRPGCPRPGPSSRCRRSRPNPRP